MDEPSRAVRKIREQQVEEPLQQAYARIAQAQFKALGADMYPDATFTLRLAYGAVRGYEKLGVAVPAYTTLGGTFTHAEEHHNAKPFRLPESWTQHKSDLDLSVPFNFVSTADIIGGNSGSPVVQPRRGIRWHHLRREYRIAGAGFRLHQRKGTGRVGAFGGDYGSAAESVWGDGTGRRIAGFGDTMIASL